MLLIASLDNAIKNNGANSQYHLLCFFSGYIGIASWLLSLFAMVSMAGNLLVWLLCPRRFNCGKDYLPRMRAIAIIQGTIIFMLILLLFILIDVLDIAQLGSFNHTLCLPLNPSSAPMWEVTLALYVIESLGIFTLFLLCAIMLCHLSRQRGAMVTVLPMEARLLQKDSLLIKRLCCLFLGAALFWIPPLLTLLCLIAGMDVSVVILKWIFGVVQPLASVAGPLLYILRHCCINYTVSSCMKATRSKVAKMKDTVQLQIDQATGAITLPQDINIEGVTNGSNTTTSVESVAISTRHKARKSCNAPMVVNWVETVPIIGRHMNMNFGIVEWQLKNGSPRRGLLKIFTKPHSREWRNESAILHRLSRLEHHRNIVDYLWHSKSNQTKLDRGETDMPVRVSEEEKPTIQRYICTAYYQHGTLRDFLHSHPRTIQDNHVHAIATQVSAGMAYLHAMSIIHGLLETTSVLIGGHIETMAIKVVIANFSKSVDLTRKPTMPETEGGTTTVSREGPTSSCEANIHVLAPTASQQMHKTEAKLAETPVFVSDVRSFALLLLEMVAWLKMIRAPEEGRSGSGRHGQSWTLDRNSRSRQLSRGWTLTPGDVDSNWSDQGYCVANGSVDSGGSDMNSSTDDCLTDGGVDDRRAPSALCQQRFPSHEDINAISTLPGTPLWEEIGTFPRRGKRHELQAAGEEFPSDSMMKGSRAEHRANRFQDSDSSTGSSKQNLSSQEDSSKRSLAKLTEDGSCCIVNPYFDMTSDDDNTGNGASKDSLNAVVKDPTQAEPSMLKTSVKLGEGCVTNSTNEVVKNKQSKMAAGGRGGNEECTKRDSLCSLDSGISSHQSSMRSSSSDKVTLNDGAAAGFIKSRNLIMKRQRMHHSELHGTFEIFPENSSENLSMSSSNNTDCGSSGQHVESWIESHAVVNGHCRSGMINSTGHQRVKPRVPETLEEVESPETQSETQPTDIISSVSEGRVRNGEMSEKCSAGKPSMDTDLANEEQHKPKASVTRSGSSLSQFYVRKRAPRPQNITIVPGTSTLPANLQRRSIHAPDSPRLMDMARGRPSSCHAQVAAAVKSNSLDSSSSHESAHHSADHNGHSSGITLPRQSRSLEDSCTCQHAAISLPPARQPQQPKNSAPPGGIDSCDNPLRRLHRQDAILESIKETSRITLAHHPSQSFEEKSQLNHKRVSSTRKVPAKNVRRVPTSGIHQQHVNFCQELQALLPCLPKVVLGFWWKQQGCGQAVLQWINSLKDYDGCLHNQLMGILESCWSKEPALTASDVHLMLDNCLTEVAL